MTMSNETSSVNKSPKVSPTRVRRGASPDSGRSRKFSCITYLSEEQLKVRLLEHSQQIRIYAYAYHDRDTKPDGSLKTPHFHLVLILYNANTISAVRRWFSGFYDENGEITTTAQICGDVYKAYDYLTHSTKECIAEGKYRYDNEIVKTNDKSRYFQAGSEADYDNITLATEMVLKSQGSLREMGQIFGRDFIVHYSTIRQYLRDVMECQKYNRNLKELFDWEFEAMIEELNK